MALVDHEPEHFRLWPRAVQACGLRAAPDVRGGRLATLGGQLSGDVLIAALHGWHEETGAAERSFAQYHRFATERRTEWSLRGRPLPSTLDPFRAPLEAERCEATQSQGGHRMQLHANAALSLNGRRGARPLYVEVKNVTAGGKQSSQYQRFLAEAPTAPANDAATNSEATPRPAVHVVHHASMGGRTAPQLTSPETIAAALDAHLALLAGQHADPEHIRELADQLWLWVVPARQDEMSVHTDHLYPVLDAIRKAQQT